MATGVGWEGRNGTAWTGMLRNSRDSEGEVSREWIVKDLACMPGSLSFVEEMWGSQLRFLNRATTWSDVFVKVLAPVTVQ